MMSRIVSLYERQLPSTVAFENYNGSFNTSIDNCDTYKEK
jgi:hypothetical protein